MDVRNLKIQIAEHRKWLRLGQASVAEYLGISKSAMSALESEENSRAIEVSELLKLCKLFMCKPNDLMEDKADSREIDAIVSTRKTNFQKEIDPRDSAEVNFFSYELKQLWKDELFKPAVHAKAKAKSISFAVDELLKEMDANSVPVDVYAIANRLGVFVKFSALTNLSGALIHPTDKNGAGILLNSNQPENRLRFSLAHEIAHYYLGHYATEGASISVMKDNSPIEKDADSFASELLVPRHLLEGEIKKQKKELNVIGVYKLADKFAVSFLAMLVTLREARFISQVQFDTFSKRRVTDLKAEVEKDTVSKKHEFDANEIQKIIDNYKFDLEFLDRDGIRLIQEIAFQKYMEDYSLSERATQVKDVYEKVVFWLVEKREECLKKNFLDSVLNTLKANNITPIDKTHSGGCLWVVSSPENDSVIEILRKKNIAFKLAENGGKATKNKRAWYLSISANSNIE